MSQYAQIFGVISIVVIVASLVWIAISLSRISETAIRIDDELANILLSGVFVQMRNTDNIPDIDGADSADTALGADLFDELYPGEIKDHEIPQ